MLKFVCEPNKHRNRDTSSENHDEYQYLNLLNDLICHGNSQTGRNGKVLSSFGSAMHFSL